MPTTSLIQQAAERLRKATQSGQTCAPVRDMIGTTDLETAYAIQKVNNRIRQQEGARIVGYKIGLTSEAVQSQLGVDQPDYGMLFHDREVLMDGVLPLNEVMQGKVEAEIAFVLKKDINDQRIGIPGLIDAIDYALVALEIVGSRIADWDIKITDTIADNASASHFVLGHRPVALADLDLLNCKMRMTSNGELVSEGEGRACLGSPLNATLWLARKMAALGEPLRAGHLLLSGALGPMTTAKPGDRVVADIEGLGEVSVRFA